MRRLGRGKGMRRIFSGSVTAGEENDEGATLVWGTFAAARRGLADREGGEGAAGDESGAGLGYKNGFRPCVFCGAASGARPRHQGHRTR